MMKKKKNITEVIYNNYEKECIFLDDKLTNKEVILEKFKRRLELKI